MHERPATGSVLQILNEDLDNGRVIYRSYAKTDRSSVWRNRNNYYWKSAAFVTRKLRDLAEDGPAALEAGSCSRGCDDVHFYSERLFRKPDNLETLSLVGRYLAEARTRAHPAGARSRSMGHRVSAVTGPVPSTTLYRFKEQWPAVGSSWADPFPVEAGDDYHVFLEVYDRAKQQGHIGVSRLTRDGAFDRPVTVLERPLPPLVSVRVSVAWQVVHDAGELERVPNRGLFSSSVSVGVDARSGVVRLPSGG